MEENHVRDIMEIVREVLEGKGIYWAAMENVKVDL